MIEKKVFIFTIRLNNVFSIVSFNYICVLFKVLKNVLQNYVSLFYDDQWHDDKLLDSF